MESPDSEGGDNVYCSVSEALKLITVPFSGKRESLEEFISNVDAAFELVNPVQHSILLKFVKARICGEARSKLLVRSLTETWKDVKQILIENYSVRRTIDFYACQMFSARQGKGDSIAVWASKVDALQSQLREAVARVISTTNLPGAISLVELLAKASFIQGLSNDRIQMIVRAKSDDDTTLGSIIELSLEEETQITSHRSYPFSSSGAKQSHKKEPVCFSCGKSGHIQNFCKVNKQKGQFKPQRYKTTQFCVLHSRERHEGPCSDDEGNTALCNFNVKTSACRREDLVPVSHCSGCCKNEGGIVQQCRNVGGQRSGPSDVIVMRDEGSRGLEAVGYRHGNSNSNNSNATDVFSHKCVCSSNVYSNSEN